MANKVKAGKPNKPLWLSKRAAEEWDRIVGEMTASGIQVSQAHRALIEQAATIAADAADARLTVETEGAYMENPKTGVMQMHPAARRLDALRRDHIKVLSLLGLRAATASQEDDREESLEDLLG